MQGLEAPSSAGFRSREGSGGTQAPSHSHCESVHAVPMGGLTKEECSGFSQSSDSARWMQSRQAVGFTAGTAVYPASHAYEQESPTQTACDGGALRSESAGQPSHTFFSPFQANPGIHLFEVFGFRISVFGFWISGLGFRVWGLGFGVSRVSDFGFRVSGSVFQDSGFGIRDSGFGIRVLCFVFSVSGLGFRVPKAARRRRVNTSRPLRPGRLGIRAAPFIVSGFVFQVSGFGFRVSVFGFRIQAFGFRVSGFGFRVSGFGFRVSGFGLKV